MATKERMNISISADTRDRLKAYEETRHTTVSQAITDWIWSQPIKGENTAGTEMEKKNDD